MTYAIYNLTEHTQLSIRGTTGTHPDSEFVFGIYMDHKCLQDDPMGSLFSPPDSAYDDMDWSEAVKMAHWILEQDKWINGEKNDQSV